MLSILLDDPLASDPAAAGQDVSHYAASVLQKELEQMPNEMNYRIPHGPAEKMAQTNEVINEIVPDFKQALFAGLQALPNVTVAQQGGEDSSVFTVYIPANDVETEYAVYCAERDIYQTYSDARFEVIVEESRDASAESG